MEKRTCLPSKRSIGERKRRSGSQGKLWRTDPQITGYNAGKKQWETNNPQATCNKRASMNSRANQHQQLSRLEMQLTCFEMPNQLISSPSLSRNLFCHANQLILCSSLYQQSQKGRFIEKERKILLHLDTNTQKKIAHISRLFLSEKLLLSLYMNYITVESDMIYRSILNKIAVKLACTNTRKKTT